MVTFTLLLFVRKLTAIRPWGVLLLFLNLALALPAQAPSVFFQQLSQENGISDSRDNSFVYKDQLGFVWISSVDGLNRFDGQNVKVYPATLSLNEGHGIFGNNIQSNFFETASGDLWFSTYNALVRYDRNTDSFHSRQFKNERDSLLTEGYHVFHLQQESGILWLKVGDRILQVPISQTADYNILPVQSKGVRFLLLDHPSPDEPTIYACPWMKNVGFERIYKDEKKEWRIDTVTAILHAANQEIRPTISQALAYADSCILFFSDMGLIKYPVGAQEVANLYQIPKLDKKGIKFGQLWKDHQLIVSSVENGLWQFDLLKDEFKPLQNKQTGLAGGLASVEPKTIFIDDEDRLWVTEENVGLSYSWLEMNTFRNPLATIPNQPVGVKFISTDEEDVLWVATQRDGIYKLNENEKIIQHFPYDQFGKAFDQLVHFYKDQQGRQWCISSHCVFRYENNNWQKIVEDQQIQLYQMCQLNSGELLLTSSNQGVKELTLVNGEWSLKTSTLFEYYKESDFLQIYQLKNGDLLLPYKNQELWVGTIQNGKIEIRNDVERISAEVFSFLEDSKRKLTWLATSKGLQAFDENYQLRQFDVARGWGSQNKNIYGMAFDQAGNLWISGNDLLWCFRPEASKQDQWRKYQMEDGLPSGQFMPYVRPSFWNNKMYFGGSKGMAVFSPDSIQAFPATPRIYIEDFLVNGRKDATTDSIQMGDILSLHYSENTLSLKLKTVGMYFSELNKLRYRLEGYYDDWQIVENGGIANFTKISPGSYTLNVQAMNANGVVGPIEELTIHFPPPIWQRTWFVIVSSLAVLLLLTLLAYAYAQRQLNIQKRQYQAVLEDRNRIASELHDDLGAGLSIIQFLSESELDDLEEGAESHRISRIFTSANDLLEKMSDIIWAMNTHNDTLENLVVYLRKYSLDYLGTNGLQATFDIPSDIPEKELSGERRRNLLLIVKEALHNVVKHANAKVVKIELDTQEKQLKMMITDDGKGLQSTGNSSTGNGLRNMQKRAKVIGGDLSFHVAKPQGTCIQVVLPLPASDNESYVSFFEKSAYFVKKKLTYFSKNDPS